MKPNYIWATSLGLLWPFLGVNLFLCLIIKYIFDLLRILKSSKIFIYKNSYPIKIDWKGFWYYFVRET